MSDQLFEHAVRNWLDDGSDRTPSAAIDAVLLAVKTTPQERDLRIPRRFNLMPTYMRLAAAIAIVAVLGVGVYAFGNLGPGGPGSLASPTPTVTPSPSAQPSPALGPIDTTAWVTYDSNRYGFSVGYPPAGWSEDPADHDWTWEDDIETWTSTATESFFNQGAGGDSGVKFSAWSVSVAPYSTDVSWIQAWCAETSQTACAGLPAGVVNVETADGHPGVLSLYGDTMAAFVDGETIYVVAIWRAENDPAVKPYGGARRLIEAYISTLTLPA